MWQPAEIATRIVILIVLVRILFYTRYLKDGRSELDLQDASRYSSAKNNEIFIFLLTRIGNILPLVVINVFVICSKSVEDSNLPLFTLENLDQ